MTLPKEVKQKIEEAAEKVARAWITSMNKKGFRYTTQDYVLIKDFYIAGAQSREEEIQKLKRQNERILSEERQRWMNAIRNVQRWYPTDIFPVDGESLDCKSAKMARLTCENVIYEHDKLLKEALSAKDGE